jgi:hypothetical protein
MINSVGPEEKWRLHPLLDSGLNNTSVRRHDNEVHLVHQTLGRLRETTPARTAPAPCELLRFECPNWMPSKVVMKSRQSLPLAPWSPSWEPLFHQCGTNPPKESWLNANGEYDTRSGPEAQTNAV